MPNSPLESAIAQIWSDVLQVGEVTVNEDFFELGGDSLQAVRMLATVEDVLGSPVSFTDFIEAPTVAQLARELGRPLLALPGSPGTDSLLATGAALPVESAGEVRAALAGTPRPASDRSGGSKDPWGPVCAAIGRGLGSVEDVALKLRIPVAEVLAVLCEAEMAGRVRRLSGGRYEVCRGN